jgi:pyrroline-5-carboxylate reductase
MTPTVAIVAQGNMGAALAKRLTEHKVTVLTALSGRSEASAKRAREAGMEAVDDRQLAEADFFLSIVPPGDAGPWPSAWRRFLRPPTRSQFTSNAMRSVRKP